MELSPKFEVEEFVSKVGWLSPQSLYGWSGTKLVPP
jgi:hypothetical protein